MKHWLPFPPVSLALLLTWLVLNQTIATAQILLGGVLGLAGGHILAMLQPPRGSAKRRVGSAALLLWLVFVDIVRSNIAVGRIVFHPGTRGRVAGFIELPLDVRHPTALALLACIITATPGTSWARYDATRNVVTIHVLDLVDEHTWIRQFKERYERRLKEMFE